MKIQGRPSNYIKYIGRTDSTVVNELVSGES